MKKEKVLFIVPPYLRYYDYVNPQFNAKSVQKKNGRFGSLPTDMPLGILSLSSYIKKHADADVKLIDFNIVLNKLERFEYASFNDFYHDFFEKEIIGKFQPTVIGISTLFTPSYKNMLDIGMVCKQLFADAMVIAGGGIPTNMHQDVFETSDHFDALCYGEGERPLVGLLLAEDKQKYMRESESWITAEKSKNKQIFKHDFIQELDEIPFYDYEICDIAEYGVNPAISAYAAIDDKMNNFHVMTSRGCPLKCTFCASHTVHGRDMRYYSLERVQADFEYLKKTYNAKTFVFQDDHFMSDKQRALDILEIVKALNVRAVFQNGLALYALDREMLEALKSAGVDQLALPVESGSDRVLNKIMHKPLKTSIISRVVNDCRELGIYTNVNILVGMPGETKQDIEDTRQFLRSLGGNWYIILFATPLAGSEMLATCIEKDYLKSSYIDTDFRKAIVETEDYTAEYIKDITYLLNLELNFVYNADIALGDYSTALKGLHNAIKAKPDHAIAYYYAAHCYEKLDDKDKSNDYLGKAREIVNESPVWQGYFDLFGLAA